MHTDNAGGARGNHAPHRLRIEVVRGRVDIGKYRSDALPVQRVCRGYERPRRYDHFAREPQRTNCYLERNGAVAHGDAVLYAEVLGDSPLELLHHRAVVGQPLVVEDLVDSLQESRAVTNVGAAHVQRLIKRGRRTMDGEISFAANDFS